MNLAYKLYALAKARRKLSETKKAKGKERKGETQVEPEIKRDENGIYGSRYVKITVGANGDFSFYDKNENRSDGNLKKLLGKSL